MVTTSEAPSHKHIYKIAIATGTTEALFFLVHNQLLLLKYLEVQCIEICDT